MEPVKNEVAVMFSGGIDSLLAAVLLQQQYDKVHLITFDKGYLEFGVKNNLSNVQKLQDLYGADRITHEVVKLKKLVRAVSVKKILKDRRKYEMEVCWCVGCRMSMNAGGLMYALENNLVGYADGSNKEQIPGPENLTGTAENFPSVVASHRAFAEQYGVKFLTPSWDFGSREKRRDYLANLGLGIDYLSRDHSKKVKGLMTKDVFFRTQPMCFSGWLIHWKRNLLGKPVKQDEALTLDYIRKKQDAVVKGYIQKYFAKKGIDIDALVQRRRQAMSKS